MTTNKQMQLVGQHVINKTDSRWSTIDATACLSKNLYNAANYIVRQEYIFNHRFIPYVRLDKLMQRNPDYCALPRKVSQGVADLAIEIVSPETTVRDRGTKLAEYEKNGVPEYWVIDPQRTQAHFYSLGEDGYYGQIIADGEGRLNSVVLPPLTLSPDVLWQEALPGYAEVSALVETMGKA